MSTSEDNVVVKTVDDVKKLCANIGLEPVELDPTAVSTVIQYLNDLRLDYTTYAVVPLGFDYGCLKNKCTKKFQSYNSNQSPLLTTELLKIIDQNNILNKPFSIGNSIRDSLGLGMSNEKLLRFQLGKFNTKGVICSANSMPGSSKPKVTGITCGDKVYANSKFDGVLGSQFKVLCPPGCGSMSEYPVFGAGKFHEKSSICRAAVMQGVVIDTEGGEVSVVTESG